jgi:ketosteroid isomerase-like protein
MAVFLTLAVAAACAPEPDADVPLDPAVLQAAADSLLDQSARAWNAGDLEGFVQWYRRGPETTFLGSRGLMHGWEAIHDRYAPAFEPGAERDSLRFEGLESRPLASGLGLATARYVLFRSDSVTSAGVFTLILRDTREGWRIIHDHTSELTVEPDR